MLLLRAGSHLPLCASDCVHVCVLHQVKHISPPALAAPHFLISLCCCLASPCRDQRPLMFLRSTADGSVSVFLGKNEVKRLARGADAVAFDEATKTLALLDRAKATITIHRFNERLSHLDPTPTEIDLSETQSEAVEWMSLAQGAERLVVVAGGGVQVFALDQGGMPRPGPIQLMYPFSGTACLSPDGRSLFVLSTSSAPEPPAEPSPAPEPDSAAGAAQSSPVAQGLHAGDPVNKAAPAPDSSGDVPASHLAMPGMPAPKVAPLGHPGLDPLPGPPPLPMPATGNPAKATQEGGPLAPLGQEGEGQEPTETRDPAVSDVQGKEAPGELSLDVYLLGSMTFHSSFPLEGVTGTPQEWSLGSTVIGAQRSLLLHHHSSGTIQSMVLEIETREQEYRMRPEAVPEERKPGEVLFAASPAPALEAMYHTMDKFPTSPCLSSGTRDLALRLVLPSTEPGFVPPGRPGEPQGVPGVLESHVASLQEKLKTESAKDFTRLALHVSTVKSSAEFSASNSSGRVVTVAAAPEAAKAAQCSGQQPSVQLSHWAQTVMALVPVQIARAQGNSLHPMKDGLHLPPDAMYTDAVSLSRLLSFGPYDSLLTSWHGPVKVVSSMGKQSSGKSYLMNHLSGTVLFPPIPCTPQPHKQEAISSRSCCLPSAPGNSCQQMP